MEYSCAGQIDSTEAATRRSRTEIPVCGLSRRLQRLSAFVLLICPAQLRQHWLDSHRREMASPNLAFSVERLLSTSSRWI